MIRSINGIDYNPPSVKGNNTTASIGTTETILNSVLVPGNTFKIYDVVGVQTRIRKTNAISNVTIRMRIGTTLNTTQTLAGTFTTSSNLHTFIPFDRRMSIQNLTTNTTVVSASTSIVSDGAGNFTNSESVLAIDWTVDNYIIITGQSASSTNTLNCGYIYLDLIEYGNQPI